MRPPATSHDLLWTPAPAFELRQVHSLRAAIVSLEETSSARMAEATKLREELQANLVAVREHASGESASLHTRLSAMHTEGERLRTELVASQARAEGLGRQLGEVEGQLTEAEGARSGTRRQMSLLDDERKTLIREVAALRSKATQSEQLQLDAESALQRENESARRAAAAHTADRSALLAELAALREATLKEGYHAAMPPRYHVAAGSVSGVSGVFARFAHAGVMRGREVRAALRWYGLDVNMADVGRLLERYDERPDSVLDMAEFQQLVADLEAGLWRHRIHAPSVTSVPEALAPSHVAVSASLEAEIAAEIEMETRGAAAAAAASQPLDAQIDGARPAPILTPPSLTPSPVHRRATEGLPAHLEAEIASLQSSPGSRA
jgi:hypothetical protein